MKKRLLKTENKILKEIESLKVHIKLLLKNSGNKIIAITSCEDKAGKTTIATELCKAMEKDNERTLLIQWNLEKRSGINKDNTDILPDNIDISKDIYNCDNSFDRLLLGGSNYIDTRMNKNLKELFEKVKDLYNYIVIDLETINKSANAQYLASQIGQVLLVLELGKTKKEEIKRSKRILRSLNCDLLGIVFNKN